MTLKQLILFIFSYFIASQTAFSVTQEDLRKLELLDMLDQIDYLDFKNAIDTAYDCMKARKISCAKEKIESAKMYVYEDSQNEVIAKANADLSTTVARIEQEEYERQLKYRRMLQRQEEERAEEERRIREAEREDAMQRAAEQDRRRNQAINDGLNAFTNAMQNKIQNDRIRSETFINNIKNNRATEARIAAENKRKNEQWKKQQEELISESIRQISNQYKQSSNNSSNTIKKQTNFKTSSDEKSTGNSQKQASTKSCPAGTDQPYNDFELDVHCRTACHYLSVGQMDGVKASCGILHRMGESHQIGEPVSAKRCFACTQI